MALNAKEVGAARHHHEIRFGDGGHTLRSGPRPRIGGHRRIDEDNEKAKVKRGELYWAELQTGRRPVIVVSNGPTVVEIPAGVAGLTRPSVAICHQITTLDRAKLTRRIGLLPAHLVNDMDEALKAALDLD